MNKVKTASTLLLRSKEQQKDWSKKQKVLYELGNIGLPLLACFALTLMTLLLSSGMISAAVFKGYWERPMIILVNFAIIGATFMGFHLLIGRSWIAFLISWVLWLGIAIANYCMILLRADILRFADFFCLREALDITAEQSYSLPIDWRVILGVLVCAGFTVLLGLFARKYRPVKKRLIQLLVTGVCVILAGYAMYSGAIFSGPCKYFKYINSWSSTQVAMSRGVVYSFSRDALFTRSNKPENYSKDNAQQQLSAFTDADIPEDKKVNLIVIMRESYNDLSDLGGSGVDWSIYDTYHALADESYTGRLISNGFGGNTKDAERGFLTGSRRITDYRKPVNSYVWYLRQQGYYTEGDHPFNGWFYNRLNVNRYLGFENYRFREDTYGALEAERKPAKDTIVYDGILKAFQEHDSSTPYFNYSVTFEGHGPYASAYDNQYGDRNNIVENGGTPEANVLNNYLNCEAKRDETLMTLVEELRKSDRPVVLMVYGDHNPSLNGENGPTDGFTGIGMNMDTSTEDGFMNYYSTEYLIWANDAAKSMLDFDFTGEGPTISPCYLMNVLADALGWKGPAYLQAMRSFMDEFPIVSLNGIVSVNGELYQSVPSAYTEDYQDLLDVNYYWQDNFLYSDLTE